MYPRICAQDMLDHLALLKGFVHRKERRELVEAMLNRINLYAVRKKALPVFRAACASDSDRPGADGQPASS